MSGKKIKLFIDIDDVLIGSSTLIQNYVENNTIFSKAKLEIIEQINRNCSFFTSKIRKECEMAKKEMRLPNLKRFPNMEKYSFDKPFSELSDKEKEYIYSAPIKDAIEYENIAIRMYNQFLELRDMFLENDNLRRGESKKYNYFLEGKKLLEFKSCISNNIDSLSNINEYCYKCALAISQDALQKGIAPNYRELVKMDNNDIIRTNVEENSNSFFAYEKPIEDINKCRGNDIFLYMLKNFEVKKTPSEEIVDYEKIYQQENVNKKAVRVIQKLLSSGMVDISFAITHHNGEREERAKRRLISEILPNTNFIGLRFHETEHNLERRTRSSKFKYASMICNYEHELMLLLDDSRDNCSDWEKNEGNVILYRPVTDAEKTTKVKRDEFNRIISFDELEEKVCEIYQNINCKRKVRK